MLAVGPFAGYCNAPASMPTPAVAPRRPQPHVGGAPNAGFTRSSSHSYNNRRSDHYGRAHPFPPNSGGAFRRPREVPASAFRLEAHRSVSSTTEARASSGGGRVGTRLNRPTGGRGRGERYGSDGGGGPRNTTPKGGARVTKREQAAAAADWRDAGLDGKSRSFLFVKEIKAIPKWNGVKVIKVLEEAHRLSGGRDEADRGTGAGTGGSDGGSGGGGRDPKRLQMTSFMYNACISHMSMCGRWQEALQVLDLMREVDFPPDEFCVTAAITACGRAGQWQKSLDVSFSSFGLYC